MRSPGAWISTWRPSRWATTATASRCYLRDIWPTPKEVEETVRGAVTTEMYRKEYGASF